MKKRSEAPTLLEDFDPETFEIKTLDDFKIWNKWARKNGHPIKVPTEDYYKKVKVKFQRFDQPENTLKARVRNKDIDWTGQLIPGKTYDLCIPVVKFLNGLAEPDFKEVKSFENGETIVETKQVGEKSRFSCQVIDFGDEDAA